MSLLMVLDVLIIGFLVFGNLKLYSENKHINSQYWSLHKELEGLEQRNEELQDLFSMAGREENSERFLREKGMYKKPGEEVVVIKREQFQKGSSQTNVLPKETASLLDKIVNFFKAVFGRD